MNTNLSRGKWSHFEAVTLETECLRLVVVPEIGGRIVSLLDKRSGYEWLVQPEQSHPAQQVEYGSDFNSQTSGGWDEMFPTIIADTYPRVDESPLSAGGSRAEVVLPDHGELWSVPWQVVDLSADSLTMAVRGKALPYRLARRLTLAGPVEVQSHYTLMNLGDVPLMYLWAAHPQFSCLPSARILLPTEVNHIISVIPLEWTDEWGPPGTTNPWPEKIAADGTPTRLDIVVGTERQRARKKLQK